jgi:hypothetical protein
MTKLGRSVARLVSVAEARQMLADPLESTQPPGAPHGSTP